MSNPFSKLASWQLPGNLYQTTLGEGNRLAIESRKDNNVYFSIIDLTSGRLISEKQAKAVTVWHSLLALDKKSLILQHFESRKNPDQVSLVRYHLAEDRLEGEVSNSEIQSFALGEPALFMADSRSFATVKQFIGQNIVLGCEYWESEESIVVSYYLFDNESFTRKLMALKNGQVVLNEIQDKELKGFAPGSFFTFQNRLIFANEKREINIYEI